MGFPDGPTDGDRREPADSPLVHVVIPDDARELAYEAELLRRERRAAARRARIGRVFATRRWRRYGLSGPLVAAVLLVVGIFGVLLVALGPRGGGRINAAPLATGVAAPRGAVGGLLPTGTVLDHGQPLSLQDARLRPAVLLLLPGAGCDCAAEVGSVQREAANYDVQTVLVADGRDEGAVAQLADRATGGAAGLVADPAGRLNAAYHATGLTAVLVRPDGIVVDVSRDLVKGDLLSPLIQQVLPAGQLG